MKVLLIGNGAREHAIAEAIKRSRHTPELVVFADKVNPALQSIADVYGRAESLISFDELKNCVEEERPDFAVVGPEAPLVAGVVDFLAGLGVPAVGPTKELAQLEGSKAFTRALLADDALPGNPRFIVVKAPDGVREIHRETIEKFMQAVDGQFVVKADGLKSGKGVMVVGDHLAGITDGLTCALECLADDGRVVIEEKLVGEEFSLIFLTDGKTLRACPAIQDHKRVFDGDMGPNTGGMGCYSDVGGTLPFITPEDITTATEITQNVLDALNRKFPNQPYRGVMYGGFMATKNGVSLIEYNARFGDPEAMNILPIMTSDFVDVCLAIIDGTLDTQPVEFAPVATVVKYVVPEGYPTEPRSGEVLTMGAIPPGCRMYFAAVDTDAEGFVRTTGGRAIASLGIASSLPEAEMIAEAGTLAIGGAVMHRRDIGTAPLIARRIAHMRELRG